jgi:tetratricopeptide (TPR) repeat protein
VLEVLLQEDALMKIATPALAFVLLLGSAPAVRAQSTGPMSGAVIGPNYKDDSQLAADHYAKGIRSKRKADKESVPEKKTKLYEKAKEELLKSVGLDASYDALLALGQVDLALGQATAALDACSQALSFRPGDGAAQSCVEEARKAGA